MATKPEANPAEKKRRTVTPAVRVVIDSDVSNHLNTIRGDIQGKIGLEMDDKAVVKYALRKVALELNGNSKSE